MKFVGIEHCDDGIMRPKVIDLDQSTAAELLSGKICALDLDLHVVMSFDQAKDFAADIVALVARNS